MRKTKTDKQDAFTIAQFLLAHKDSLSKVAFSQNSQDLKDLARERISDGDDLGVKERHPEAPQDDVSGAGVSV